MVKKYVIGGGSRTGKTSTLYELGKQGYQVFPETARMVLESDKYKMNAKKRQNLIMGMQRGLERSLDDMFTHDDIVFLDRGVPDIMAFTKHLYGDTNDRVPYKYDGVFILEPCIFAYDNVTIEKDDKDIMDVHKLIWETYKKEGYNPIPIGGKTPQERAKRILEHIVR